MLTIKDIKRSVERVIISDKTPLTLLRAKEASLEFFDLIKAFIDSA